MHGKNNLKYYSLILELSKIGQKLIPKCLRIIEIDEKDQNTYAEEIPVTSADTVTLPTHFFETSPLVFEAKL